MKNLITKIQDISQKAAKIAEAVHGAPARAAELRAAVASTVSQLQMVNADVQATVKELGLPDQEQMVEALREIDQHADVFSSAGYDVQELEMRLAYPLQLDVHLRKNKNSTSPHALEALQTRYAHLKVVKALLAALKRAESAVPEVELENLQFEKLIVSFGNLPSARLSWGARKMALPPPITSPVASPTTQEKNIPQRPSTFEGFGGTGSFFGQKKTEDATVLSNPVIRVDLPQSASTSTSQVQPSKTSTTTASVVSEGVDDPLARFKKMPDLSKRSPSSYGRR